MQCGGWWYNIGMAKVGRPTKLTKATQKRADDYAAGGFVNAGDVVPSRAGLAVHLDVTRQTLTNWSKESDQFLATLDRINTTQEKMALSGGLIGDYNSVIAKLLLANHGYSDKQDLSSSDGSMTPKAFDPSKMSTAWLQELVDKANDSDDNSD